ncbi:ParB/Srx family N-terminal domain-containing protein [Clostridium cellulovorans]|uniref:ParB domain protein nuclease n=1 Tax=Clostridium cellulovorans (strain ATCC 35296 / DSM 3052 / OCM 3 / 743B) TaxID=573061 RepID=D9ST83_CLOC7|nr:ParB/Srx family N-terminal domain-containing protein [Clostridium cellulovorans]ADL50699.1 ParB domain protein nuclease [Clostridium cellulovorans 743B]
MKDMKFTVEEAISFSKEGKIEEWVHLFLNSVGNNVPFSEGLKLQKRYWTGPLLISIDKLRRCCGPEPGMEYYNPPEHWEPRIFNLQELIRKGWGMPPLIVQHEGDDFRINDGNHRVEAMTREGIEKCWVIIWNSHYQDDINDFY